MADDLMARRRNDGLAPQRLRYGHTIFDPGQSLGDCEATDQLLTAELARRHAALREQLIARSRRAWDWWRGQR